MIATLPSWGSVPPYKLLDPSLFSHYTYIWKYSLLQAQDWTWKHSSRMRTTHLSAVRFWWSSLDVCTGRGVGYPGPMSGWVLYPTPDLYPTPSGPISYPPDLYPTPRPIPYPLDLYPTIMHLCLTPMDLYPISPGPIPYPSWTYSLWTDSRLWKHYLPATTVAGGKNIFRMT